MFKYQEFGVRYCDGKQVGTSLHGVNHINQWNSLKLVGGFDHDGMVVRFTTTMQSMPITTKVVSWNPAHREVYSIQQYVIKFVSD